MGKLMINHTSSDRLAMYELISRGPHKNPKISAQLTEMSRYLSLSTTEGEPRLQLTERKSQKLGAIQWPWWQTQQPLPSHTAKFLGSLHMRTITSLRCSSPSEPWWFSLSLGATWLAQQSDEWLWAYSFQRGTNCHWASSEIRLIGIKEVHTWFPVSILRTTPKRKVASSQKFLWDSASLERAEGIWCGKWYREANMSWTDYWNNHFPMVTWALWPMKLTSNAPEVPTLLLSLEVALRTPTIQSFALSESASFSTIGPLLWFLSGCIGHK